MSEDTDKNMDRSVVKTTVSTNPVDQALDKALNLSDLVGEALSDTYKQDLDVDNIFGYLAKGNNSGSAHMLYNGLKITPDVAHRIKGHLSAMKHGTAAAVPLICQGWDKCPLKHHCYFAVKDDDGNLDPEASVFPLLRPCPVETSVMQLKISQYVSEYLGEHKKISPSIMTLVTKLAEYDIYEIRCDSVLANGDARSEGTDFMQSFVEHVDFNSTVYTGYREHPIFKVKEKLQSSREKVLKQLLSTPEAKANASNKLSQQVVSSDISTTLSKMGNLLSKIEQQSGTGFSGPRNTKTVNVSGGQDGD